MGATRLLRLRARAAILGLAIVGAGAFVRLVACGPYFPNSLIDDGDRSVLQAPVVSFLHELKRLQLEPPARLEHVVQTNESLHGATLDTEIVDLRRALGQRGILGDEQSALVLEFSRRRADLTALRLAFEDASRESADREVEKDEAGAADQGASATPFTPRASLEWAPLPIGVPREFDLYLEGAAAWYSQEAGRARALWERVLGLPVADRTYKSTWAAYMKGRSWHEEDPALAMRWYAKTRTLSGAGFADSASLGVASFGWEAQLRLREGDIPGAMRLYLDQFAAGSTHSSPQSLALCVSRLDDAGPQQRERIARDRTLRRVVTAWFLAYASWDHLLPSERPSADRPMPAQRWLEELESVRAGEVPLAEQLALLAYRTGDWDAAQRWADLAADSLVARWVRAKLHLQAGEIPEAAAELAGVVARLPLEPEPVLRGQAPDFAESLTAGPDDAAARFQVRGELAMIKLARGDFEQALDLFVRARFWRDAAYVAERVLSTDELKAYVDRAWPSAGRSGEGEGEEGHEGGNDLREELRNLLARRLNRERRASEALSYLPVRWHAAQTNLVRELAIFRDASLESSARARAGATAAWSMSTNGMELFGTELAPDFTLFGGAFDLNEIYPGRASTNDPLTRATLRELQRARARAPEPYARFHYRYVAAQLAWDAAKLMPDQDPGTAQLLYDAGSWLKARDPFTADLFYKALVNRCRETPLGEAADRQRWFPPLDANGIPYVTRRGWVPGPVTESVEPVAAEAWAEDEQPVDDMESGPERENFFP